MPALTHPSIRTHPAKRMQSPNEHNNKSMWIVSSFFSKISMNFFRSYFYAAKERTDKTVNVDLTDSSVFFPISNVWEIEKEKRRKSETKNSRELNWLVADCFCPRVSRRCICLGFSKRIRIRIVVCTIFVLVAYAVTDTSTSILGGSAFNRRAPTPKNTTKKTTQKTNTNKAWRKTKK